MFDLLPVSLFFFPEFNIFLEATAVFKAHSCQSLFVLKKPEGEGPFLYVVNGVSGIIKPSFPTKRH